MMSARPVGLAFHEGDEVVPAEGTYQGTPGVFLRLTKDANPAVITERSRRQHRMAWLAYAADTNRGFAQ